MIVEIIKLEEDETDRNTTLITAKFIIPEVFVFTPPLPTNISKDISQYRERKEGTREKAEEDRKTLRLGFASLRTDTRRTERDEYYERRAIVKVLKDIKNAIEGERSLLYLGQEKEELGLLNAIALIKEKLNTIESGDKNDR